MRKAIMTAKGMTSSEGLRGIEYQLLNALAVRNVNKFMDVVMRLYSAYGSKRNEDGHELLIPTGFVQMLNDKSRNLTRIWICVCNGISRILRA